ncbi:MAG: prolyl oligopeptidase family serine peptidase [Chitinispirillaceae bacterium]|nr:prolyl oligopeptidase family serine peptidase [Chitinispirillaceae bacterium]
MGVSIAQQTKYTGTINNLSREWIFYVPQNLPESPPLVFCLQGCCSDYNMWASSSGYNKVADTAKIVVCYPRAINTNYGGQINDRDWDITEDRDLDFILALIDTAVKKYNVDQNRIYATGFSYGGCFSNYLACRYPDIFAAIAPSAGYVMTLPHQERTNCSDSRPVPLLHMHGTSDRVVEYRWGVMSVELWVDMNECPKSPEVTEHYKGSATVKMEYYGPCKDNTEVIFLSAQGMDHAWMSESQVGVSAAVESWNFMSKYSLEPPVAADRKTSKPATMSMSLTARYHAGTISLHGLNEALHIRLVDMNGRELGAWRRPDGSCPLSTGRLNRGIYLLLVYHTKGSVVMRILVT